MADYNRQNFNNMKQEAVRNAQEMHKRTAEIPENKSDSSNDIPPANNNNNNNNNNNSSEQKKNTNSGGILGLADGIFEGLGISKGQIDSDKIIIVLMIIMLAREGADLKLLLALGYILM